MAGAIWEMVGEQAGKQAVLPLGWVLFVLIGADADGVLPRLQGRCSSIRLTL